MSGLSTAFIGLTTLVGLPAIACDMWKPTTVEERIRDEIGQASLPLIHVIGQLLDLGPQVNVTLDGGREWPARCGTMKILENDRNYAGRLPEKVESVRICFHYDPPDFGASCSYNVSDEWIGGIWDVKARAEDGGIYWVHDAREIIAADKLEALAQHAKATQNARAQAAWLRSWIPEIKPAR